MTKNFSLSRPAGFSPAVAVSGRIRRRRRRRPGPLGPRTDLTLTDEHFSNAAYRQIDTYHIQLLAYFLDTLRRTPDGDGNLLDHSMSLRRRYRERQPPRAHQPSVPGRGRRRGPAQGRAASCLRGRHAVCEPAPVRARQGRCAGGDARRQYGAAQHGAAQRVDAPLAFAPRRRRPGQRAGPLVLIKSPEGHRRGILDEYPIAGNRRLCPRRRIRNGVTAHLLKAGSARPSQHELRIVL